MTKEEKRTYDIVYNSNPINKARKALIQRMWHAANTDYYQKRYVRNPEGKRESQRKWVKAHPETHREASRRWYAAHQEIEADRKRKYRELHPLSVKAHSTINNGIAAGKIFKPGECSLCGKTARIEGHHPDYAKPKDVVWLCGACHAREKK